MIHTALESLDILFFDDKILGTTGVLYMFLSYFICGLEYRKLFHSKIRLNQCHFGVPYVPIWYPKLFVRKSMISRLYNAVSDTFFKYRYMYLDAFVCYCEA